jgi:hypothetical protein
MMVLVHYFLPGGIAIEEDRLLVRRGAATSS